MPPTFVSCRRRGQPPDEKGRWEEGQGHGEEGAQQGRGNKGRRRPRTGRAPGLSFPLDKPPLTLSGAQEAEVWGRGTPVCSGRVWEGRALRAAGLGNSPGAHPSLGLLPRAQVQPWDPNKSQLHPPNGSPPEEGPDPACYHRNQVLPVTQAHGLTAGAGGPGTLKSQPRKESAPTEALHLTGGPRDRLHSNCHTESTPKGHSREAAKVRGSQRWPRGPKLSLMSL